MTSWVVLGFSCGDMVAALIKCFKDGAQEQLVVCSSYLPYGSENPHPAKEFKELVRYF
jgi:hypothetical protein